MPQIHTVLVVDDSQPARMAACKALGAMRPEWATEQADSAEAALARLDRLDVQSALLDLDMPGLDGFELAERLLAWKPELPIGILTGNVDPAVRARAEALGYLFLRKPVIGRQIRPFVEFVEKVDQAVAA